MWTRQARFAALVDAYSADLYRFAVWLCGDEDLARDLVQETFMRTWRSLDALREEGAAKAWLFTTLRRELARHFERNRPEIVEFPVEGVADARPGVDTRPEALALRQALAGLSSDYREPLLLQVIGGYSCKEIAEELEISTAAVMTRLFRARQKLRRILEAPDEQEVESR